MKIFLFALLCLGVLFLGLATYVRIAPVDPARWHVDPDEAADPGGRGVLIRRDTALSAQEALGALDQIILATRRAERIAGDMGSGILTYQVRTKLMRYPDYVTIKATPSDDGSSLTILSRARFGQSDLGVNGARVAEWLAQFDAQGG